MKINLLFRLVVYFYTWSLHYVIMQDRPDDPTIKFFKNLLSGQ